MQLPWDEHFAEIVIPAWQAYLQAESRFTEALAGGSESQIRKAKYDALREGGAAAFYIHHFGEIILRTRPAWLPKHITNLGQIRSWLSNHCTMLRTTEAIGDVSLLGDVADALKHAILTKHLESREVSVNDAVLVAGREYGQCRYGEGKYGGIDQVWVLATSGGRPLSSILQNVIDAWRRAAGIDLPSIGLA